jgi:hypothetical protein
VAQIRTINFVHSKLKQIAPQFHCGFHTATNISVTFVVMNMLDKNGIRIDLRSGSHIRIRRSWCTPLAGRSGVVLAIELDDPYGTYLIRFQDGLQFRYERRDLEVMAARCTLPERVRAFLSSMKVLNRGEKVSTLGATSDAELHTSTHIDS